MGRSLEDIQPFEICSIRPPTENYSLTFRLTRNCGWNRCLFCPVYKFGAKFSRRGLDEIKKDVDHARVIYDLLNDLELEGSYPSEQDIYEEAEGLVEKINLVQGVKVYDSAEQSFTSGSAHSVMRAENPEDERLEWFASWFKDAPTLEDSIFHVLTWRRHGGDTCFLGDANSLLLSSGFFAEAVRYIRDAFPSLRRFTVYGRTKSAAKRPSEDMMAFREAGLDRVHFGLESGSDRVLAIMKKGVTAREHVEGCRNAKMAGISCSVYVMPGLGGMAWSDEHGRETARVISEAEPDFVRLRTLEIFPRTGLSHALAHGEFIEASEEKVAEEIKILIENITCATTIVSDSAANLLDLHGTLPVDRDRLVGIIEAYLSLSPREKLIFSFSSRLQSFMGQYGRVPSDLLRELTPYLVDGMVDLSRASDEEIARITRLIRSKLMP